MTRSAIKSEYKLGEWLRVWNNVGQQGQTIGFVTGHGEARNHWTGSFEAQTVIIRNATGGCEVPESLVIERIDPVVEWNRIQPGEPLPAWLQEHLKARVIT